jgi:carbon monoxide dehydrogenase subunit G
MSTRVEKTIMVNVPVSRAYNQWTQFEDFPQFMGGVQSVTQLGDDRLDWVAQIAGVRRTWQARILEQVPDRKVAWAATEGATNAGAVTFEDLGGDQTSVTLVLEYEPEGLVEKVGDKLNVVENQAEADLERFKAFIESEGYASGAWRGSVAADAPVGTPGVEHAASSRGDSGKAGLSGKAVAAGIGVAAAAAAAVVSSRSGDTNGEQVDSTPAPVTETPAPVVVDTRVGTSADLPASDVQQGEGIHLLTDEEIDEGATTVPPTAAESSVGTPDRRSDD